MCLDRQICVSGKFWNINKGHMDDQEGNTPYKCTVHRYHDLHKWVGGDVPSQTTGDGSVDFDVVRDEIRRWSSLSEDEYQWFVGTEDGVLNEVEMMWQIRILFPLNFVVFNQTVCHLTAETNVEKVFSRVGQLSEVNLDPDVLPDMISIMELGVEWGLSCVWERNQSVVCKWGPHKFLVYLSMLRVTLSWVWVRRILVLKINS